MVNYALLALPAYTVLILVPHIYAFSIALPTNVMKNANPHSSSLPAALQKALGPRAFAQYERAESAHRNTIENAPLFFATVLLSVLAESVSRQEVGSAWFAGLFLGLRVAYTGLYISTEDEGLSRVRSFVFMGSLALAFWQIWKCAVVLG